MKLSNLQFIARIDTLATLAALIKNPHAPELSIAEPDTYLRTMIDEGLCTHEEAMAAVAEAIFRIAPGINFQPETCGTLGSFIRRPFLSIPMMVEDKILALYNEENVPAMIQQADNIFLSAGKLPPARWGA